LVPLAAVAFNYGVGSIGRHLEDTLGDAAILYAAFWGLGCVASAFFE
jgi:hypothetical protein